MAEPEVKPTLELMFDEGQIKVSVVGTWSSEMMVYAVHAVAKAFDSILKDSMAPTSVMEFFWGHIKDSSMEELKIISKVDGGTTVH